jgi:hypothetical protein
LPWKKSSGLRFVKVAEPWARASSAKFWNKKRDEYHDYE